MPRRSTSALSIRRNQAGKVLVHRNLQARPDHFLNALAPFRQQDIAVAAECVFAWYWLDDPSAAKRRRVWETAERRRVGWKPR